MHWRQRLSPSQETPLQVSSTAARTRTISLPLSTPWPPPSMVIFRPKRDLGQSRQISISIRNLLDVKLKDFRSSNFLPSARVQSRAEFSHQAYFRQSRKETLRSQSQSYHSPMFQLPKLSSRSWHQHKRSQEKLLKSPRWSKQRKWRRTSLWRTV